MCAHLAVLYPSSALLAVDEFLGRVVVYGEDRFALGAEWIASIHDFEASLARNCIPWTGVGCSFGSATGHHCSHRTFESVHLASCVRV